MVISQIMGGFGNQLGEYACGYSLAKYLGQELVLDVSDYVCRGYFRPYCLDKLQIGRHRKLAYPPVSLKFMEAECIPKELLSDYGLRIINLSEVETREELLTAVKGAQNIYLMGYGGIHYCTNADRDELRAKYRMKTPSTAVEQFKKRIREEYSVAVHLRRTDFVTLKCQTSTDYFRAAITYVRIFYPDAHFYFFSDDIGYAKEQFGACPNYHYVHLLGGMDADLDEFFCISACDGRILSTDSTFSAWASELNQKKGKLEIWKEALWGENYIRLNEAAIERLCGQYRPERMPLVRTETGAAINAAFDLVSQERNEQAIEVIEKVSFDSYGFSEEDIRKLTAVKEIALAQKGEEGLPVALRSFYDQMQWEYEDPAFHADYFRALYQTGRWTESAIHAALANGFGDLEDYQEYFEEMEAMSFASELYRFLKNNPARHFIFILGDGWNYYVTYVKSLAVLLARMGQKVTFLQPSEMLIEIEDKEVQIARVLLRHREFVDVNYRYHMDKVLTPFFDPDQKGVLKLFQELVRQCAAGTDLRTVVVTTLPAVFLNSKIEGIQYVVPDICDPLNCERMYFEEELANYVVYMAEQADAIFLSGPVYETIRRLYGSKVHRAFPVWDSEKYQFFDREIDFTPNYIHSEEMIRNAAKFLMI